MKTIILLLISAFCTCLGLPAGSQPQFSGWLASFNTVKTGKRTSLHSDIQWRSTGHISHTQTWLLRAGLNISLQKNMTVTAGYAYISNRRAVAEITGYVPEHRTWEQLLYTHKAGPVSVSHRFRLEQRFLTRTRVAGGELARDGSDYANRFRYFIRNILPLQQRPVFRQGWFAALQNEVFLNFGNTTAVNGRVFDQNRFYLALGYRLHPSFDMEAGYMNQYIDGRGRSFTNSHVAQVAGYLRL